MTIIDVSTHNQNDGLYSLALAVSLAMEGCEQIGGHNIPDFVKNIRVDNIYANANAAHLEKLGFLLRDELAKALYADKAMEYVLFPKILQLLLEPSKKIYTPSFVVPNEKSLIEIKYDIGAKAEKLFQLEAAQEVRVEEQNMSKQDTIVFAHKIVAVIQSGQTREKVWLLLDEMNLHNSTSDVLKLCKGFNAALGRLSVTTEQGVLQLNQLKAFMREWFDNKAEKFIAIDDEQQIIIRLLELGRCLSYINGIEDHKSNAIEIYVPILLRGKWNELYAKYVEFVRTNPVMLTAHELTCLATAWNVGLEIRVNSSLHKLQRGLTPVFNVSIISADNHWQVFTNRPVEQQVAMPDKPVEQQAAISDKPPVPVNFSQQFSKTQQLTGTVVAPISDVLAAIFKGLIGLHKTMGVIFEEGKPADIGDKKAADVEEYQMVCDKDGRIKLHPEKISTLPKFKFLETQSFNDAPAATAVAYGKRVLGYGCVGGAVKGAASEAVGVTAGIQAARASFAAGAGVGEVIGVGAAAVATPLLFGLATVSAVASVGVTYEQRRFAIMLKEMLSKYKKHTDKRSLRNIEQTLQQELYAAYMYRSVRNTTAVEFCDLFLAVIRVKMFELQYIKEDEELKMCDVYAKLCKMYDSFTDRQIKFLALNQIIYVLKHKDFNLESKKTDKAARADIVGKDEETEMSTQKRQSLLNARLQDLSAKYNDFVWSYFNMAWTAYGELLDVFEQRVLNGNTDVGKLDFRLQLNKMLRFDGLYCLRFANERGQLCEALLKFSQALSNLLLAEHYRVGNDIAKANIEEEMARYKLNEGAELIGEFGLDKLCEVHDNGEIFVEPMTKFMHFYATRCEENGVGLSAFPALQKYVILNPAKPTNNSQGAANDAQPIMSASRAAP